MSDSVRPRRRQPTRLPRPWGSPGKNTGVGCHFLLQCMKVKRASEVAQSCLTLSDPMDCSLPGSSVHGIFQARVLECGAIAFCGSCPSITIFQILLSILTSDIVSPHFLGVPPPISFAILVHFIFYMNFRIGLSFFINVLLRLLFALLWILYLYLGRFGMFKI